MGSGAAPISAVERREIWSLRIGQFVRSLLLIALIAVCTFPLDLAAAGHWKPQWFSVGDAVFLVLVNLIAQAQISVVRGSADACQSGDYGRRPRRRVEIASVHGETLRAAVLNAARECGLGDPLSGTDGPTITFKARFAAHRLTVSFPDAALEVHGRVPFWFGADGGQMYELVTQMARRIDAGGC
jgi:hypothetical protein